MTTYLLDTSAVVAHYRRESGHADVQTLFEDSGATLLLCTPTLVELHGLLQAAGVAAAERDAVIDLYGDRLCELVPLDRKAAEAARRLRDAATGRLPLVDVLIAGCAASREAVLVHRDAHFVALPAKLLKTMRLPDRTAPPTSGDVVRVVKETAPRYKRSRRPLRRPR